MQDEEVLGKAYDARLMRGLLTYLRPYKRYVALALFLILLELLQLIFLLQICQHHIFHLMLPFLELLLLQI